MNENVFERQNPYLNEAIEHFDRYYFAAKGNAKEAWSRLSKSELDFIDEELQHCIIDPRYYLENYHIVLTEERGAKTLKFWDSQEIVYAKVLEIQADGRPVKLVVLKARQIGSCLHPCTRVLTADLRWVPIDELVVGQELVAVDEFGSGEGRTGRGMARKMRTATLEAKRDVYEPAFRLTMDNGETLLATGSHRFLCKKTGSTETAWKTVKTMRIGEEIRFVTKPWEAIEGYEDGWFGGVLDGEGSMRQKERGGCETTLSQVAGAVLERAKQYLGSRAYTFRIEEDKRKPGDTSKLGAQPVFKLVMGRMSELFKIIGTTRPSRFLKRRWWEGKELPGKGAAWELAWPKVVAVEMLLPQRMVDVQTSTGTFIAEGFVSHNSTLSEGLVFHKTIFTRGCNTIIVAQDPERAAHLFDMSRRAYDSLPWWMRPEKRYEQRGLLLEFDKEDEMERQRKPGLQSKIVVGAANKMADAGRGQTFRAFHFSELPEWPDGGLLAKSLFPTMNASDTLGFMEATAKGRQGFWYNWCCDVQTGEMPGWEFCFVEYYRVKKYSLPIKGEFVLSKEETHIREEVKQEQNFVISDETFNWVRAQKKMFISLTGDEFDFYGEYPRNPSEAFQTSGICAFPKRLLQKIRETTVNRPLWYGEIEFDIKRKADRLRLYGGETANTLHEVIPGDKIPPAREDGSRLRVWEKPEPGAEYYLGADVAMGDGGDFSCAQVIKIGRGQHPDVQVAEWNGWINATGFAYVLAGLGYWYNSAEIACEMNDVGKLTNSELFRVIEYDNIYRWKHVDKIKNFITDYFGWMTNHKTRDIIISKMREALMEKTIILRSDDLLDQMMAFTRNEDEGRYEGRGTPDDRVFGMMICRYCAHEADYGDMAAAPPKAMAVPGANYCVFDQQNRLRFKTTDRDQAEAQVKAHIGWSMQGPISTKDFSNTEFSPIHDKRGPQQKLYYEHGMAAEDINDEVIMHMQMGEGGGVLEEEDWRAI